MRAFDSLPNWFFFFMYFNFFFSLFSVGESVHGNKRRIAERVCRKLVTDTGETSLVALLTSTWRAVTFHSAIRNSVDTVINLLFRLDTRLKSNWDVKCMRKKTSFELNIWNSSVLCTELINHTNYCVHFVTCIGKNVLQIIRYFVKIRLLYRQYIFRYVQVIDLFY